MVYTYHLKSITYDDKVHLYDEYDLSGNLLNETDMQGNKRVL